MNVITCVQPINQEFAYRKDYKSKKKEGLKKEKLLYSFAFLSVPFFMALFFIAYFPILRLDIGASVIKNISFWSEPSVENSMRNYVMPIKRNSPEKSKSIPDISNLLSVVEFKDYVVKRGDTISGIAQKFSLKNMGTILAINNIERAKGLRVGQKLRIPSSDGIFYTVSKGDSLSSVADKFKLPLTAILDANDLEAQTLIVGEKLFIPGATISNFALKKALGELFIYPIDGRLTSRFGYRYDPFTGRRCYHNGVDLAAPMGTPVKSTMAGKIAYVGTSPVYGKYIIVSHSGGYQSMYGHLSKTKARRGQKVRQGSVIGFVGSTGRSTGPHLHFSVYKNGKLINPLGVLK